MRHITDDERRARLAHRQALAPYARVGTPEATVAAMTVLHATEPATVHLSVAARTDGVGVAEVERALYEDRSVVKQLAMRRTLFVFPRDLLPAAWGSASARVAGTERAKTAKDAKAGGLADDGEAWVDAARAAVLERLAGGAALGAQQLREELPLLAGRVRLGRGTKWEAEVSLAPRILTLLGAEGRIVRGHNAGHWRVSRPLWADTTSWLGERPEALAAAEGYAELVRRWLRTFGPGTEDDLVWWLGATRTAVRRALSDVAAVRVSLDGGREGWVLPDDVEPVADPGPWAALLPVLDPTTMGWRHRDFHLDPRHTPYLFDSNGNGGTTAWVDGRVVGGWVQDDEGRVRVVLRDEVSRHGRRLLETEAERLTAFLEGVVVGTVYKSRLMRGEALP